MKNITKTLLILMIILFALPVFGEGKAEGWDWVISVAGGRADYWEEHVYTPMRAKYPKL